MKHLNFLSNLLSLSLGSPYTDVSLDRRLTVGSPSGRYCSGLMRLVFILAILLTVGVGNVWGATVDITQAEVTANGADKNSYSDSYSIDGWTGRYMVAYVKSPKTYSLQLGYNTSSSKSAYNSHLATPVMAGGATSVTIATKSHNGTSTASGRKFYLCKSNDLGYVNDSHLPAAGTYGSGAISSNNGSVTITITGSPTQFYIYPDGTAYISSVTVTYSTCTALGSINGSFF